MHKKDNNDTELSIFAALSAAGGYLAAHYWFGWSIWQSVLFGLLTPIALIALLLALFIIALVWAFQGDSK